MGSLPASMLLLGLAWFAIVNASASGLSWLLGSALLRSRQRDRPAFLLGTRLLPAALSLLFVSAMFVPSQWRFEPAEIDESFGVVVFALAAFGSLILLRSGARARAVARADRRLRSGAQHRATATAGVDEVQDFPGVSLAGVLRPRILIGSAVAQQLSSEEFDVAVAHELAHRFAGDNLKRFALLCAPDVFGGSGVARQLEDRWHAAAESLADARAVNGDGRRALHLASALLKVARISAGSPPLLTSPAWSNLNDLPLLEMRVRRLVHGTAPAARRPLPGPALFAACMAMAGVLGSSVPLARSIHQATEALVRLLA
jgi:beta-lactamase regulating signal transducer with metallopeptidase domain